ncbi:hypothetical protein MMC10_009226 [Thelotrema lepadinum]|nr:hypothetical protein [Thelotrema lepadinum]
MSFSRTSNNLDKDRLYFAYGSNLHVSQMAGRCPESTFVGKATLQGYKWQINQRGVANIIESGESYVEGLLYSISEEDEESLDLSEGVSVGCYEKRNLLLDCRPVRDNSLFHLKTGSVARVLKSEKEGREKSTPPQAGQSEVTGLPKNSTPVIEHPVYEKGTVQPTEKQPQIGHDDGYNEVSTKKDPDPVIPPKESKQKTPARSQRIKALVYVSTGFTKDGVIREEYIHRMQLARSDALALEVSQSFIEECMDPFIQRPETG